MIQDWIIKNNICDTIYYPKFTDKLKILSTVQFHYYSLNIYTYIFVGK